MDFGITDDTIDWKGKKRAIRLPTLYLLEEELNAWLRLCEDGFTALGRKGVVAGEDITAMTVELSSHKAIRFKVMPAP